MFEKCDREVAVNNGNATFQDCLRPVTIYLDSQQIEHLPRQLVSIEPGFFVELSYLH